MNTRACLFLGLLGLVATGLAAQPSEGEPSHPAAALERHFEHVIEAATPSVVKVIATVPWTGAAGGEKSGKPKPKPRPDAGKDRPRMRSISVSGLIVDRAGHVAVPAEPFGERTAVFVTVQTEPGRYRQFRARLVGCDRARNVAVIRILFPTADLRPIRVGDPARLRAGSLVLSVGWPYRFPASCSSGIVAGVNREIWIGKRRFGGLIMTTATVHPGESGGALLDSGGRVVGMLMSALDPEAKAGTTGASSRSSAPRRGPGRVSAAISFAVPVDTVLVAAKAIRAKSPDEEHGGAGGRFLGVYGSYLLERNALSTQLGLPEKTGFVVSQVFEGEAAQRGGIREHDVILEIGGVKIQNTGYAILTALEKVTYGEDVPVVVMRQGRKVTLKVRFDPCPPAAKRDPSQHGKKKQP